MAMKAESEAADSTVLVDPQTRLAEWANNADEWVRLLVAEVIATGRPVGQDVIEKAYQLFREENDLDKRELPVVPLLDVETRQDESAPPLSLIRLSNVRGVNALTSGAVIEPHEGLTVLYGENGTGKTGYSRIFKALANSRTADTILGNIDADAPEGQAAKLEFKLGDDEQVLTWTGEMGVSPFTRMSIFDSPAVQPMSMKISSTSILQRLWRYLTMSRLQFGRYSPRSTRQFPSLVRMARNCSHGSNMDRASTR